SRLASFCDVFVDDGFFTADQGRRILTRAKSAGLGGKVHADELADTGGAVLAAEIDAASADHLLHASSAGIDALARTSTVGVLLPATSLAPISRSRTVGASLRPAFPSPWGPISIRTPGASPRSSRSRWRATITVFSRRRQ